jgi:amidase
VNPPAQRGLSSSARRTSEWANFRSSNSSSGWSARGGQTRNPCARSQSVGLELGLRGGRRSEPRRGGGRNRNERVDRFARREQTRSWESPTVGLLSRSGIIPVAHTQDTPGPSTRTVADRCAARCDGGSGSDDDATTSQRGAGYTKFLDAEGLKGALRGRPQAPVWE